jgi:phage terminase Nu1 subunit (DNA packaging protein)
MSSATKLANQSELADALEISDRRVRQLEDRGVVVRHSDGNYDVDRNRRRYRSFIDRNIDEVTAGVEKAAKGADDALIKCGPNPTWNSAGCLPRISVQPSESWTAP